MSAGDGAGLPINFFLFHVNPGSLESVYTCGWTQGCF
jgi:hypothetical protein